MKLLAAPIIIGSMVVGYGLTNGMGGLVRFMNGPEHSHRSPEARAKRKATIEAVFKLLAFLVIIAGFFAFVAWQHGQ